MSKALGIIIFRLKDAMFFFSFFKKSISREHLKRNLAINGNLLLQLLKFYFFIVWLLITVKNRQKI